MKMKVTKLKDSKLCKKFGCVKVTVAGRTYEIHLTADSPQVWSIFGFERHRGSFETLTQAKAFVKQLTKQILSEEKEKQLCIPLSS